MKQCCPRRLSIRIPNHKIQVTFWCSIVLSQLNKSNRPITSSYFSLYFCLSTRKQFLPDQTQGLIKFDSFTWLYSRVVSIYNLNYRNLASADWLRVSVNSIAGFHPKIDAEAIKMPSIKITTKLSKIKSLPEGATSKHTRRCKMLRAVRAEDVRQISKPERISPHRHQQTLVRRAEKYTE